MAERNEPPAAIEGDQVLITGQDIVPSGPPRRLRGTAAIVFGIAVKRRGSAVIMKECGRERPRIRTYSMLDSGDRISGRDLFGLATKPLGRDDIKIGDRGRTSAHKGQELYVTDGCLVELVSGWRGIPLNEHPKDALLL